MHEVAAETGDVLYCSTCISETHWPLLLTPFPPVSPPSGHCKQRQCFWRGARHGHTFPSDRIWRTSADSVCTVRRQPRVMIGWGPDQGFAVASIRNRRPEWTRTSRWHATARGAAQVMQTRRCGPGATPMSSRAESESAADWRTAPPHRYADRIHRLPRQCPSNVLGVFLTQNSRSCVGRCSQSAWISGGSARHGKARRPHPICEPRSVLVRQTSHLWLKKASPPPLLFLSSLLLFFSSPSSASDFTSTRTYKDHSWPQCWYTSLSQPDPHYHKPVLLLCCLSSLQQQISISLCCIVTVSFYIQSSNSSRTCSFLFSFPFWSLYAFYEFLPVDLGKRSIPFGPYQPITFHWISVRSPG